MQDEVREHKAMDRLIQSLAEVVRQNAISKAKYRSCFKHATVAFVLGHVLFCSCVTRL